MAVFHLIFPSAIDLVETCAGPSNIKVLMHLTDPIPTDHWLKVAYGGQTIFTFFTIPQNFVSFLWCFYITDSLQKLWMFQMVQCSLHSNHKSVPFNVGCHYSKEPETDIPEPKTWNYRFCSNKYGNYWCSSFKPQAGHLRSFFVVF